MSENPKPVRRSRRIGVRRSMMGIKITIEARRVLERLAASRNLTLSAYVSELAEAHSARSAARAA
jgi:hypothetical protein